MEKNQQNTPLRIAIVAGETSGDLLGAQLIQALRTYYPNMIIEGIGGQRMQQAGVRSLFPLEALSVMGISEVIRHIPHILSIRRRLYRHFCQQLPDVFIGIDAPDFNLTLARKLRKKGIKTVHYVSPSVWAWRKWRIHKIKRSIDLMLTLLPFETQIYQQHHIPVKFVGHPLADLIPFTSDKVAAREQLQLPAQVRVIAMLPGSRRVELNYLSELFINTAKAMLLNYPDLRFVVPVVNAQRRQQFTEIWQRVAPDLPFVIIDGQAQLAMTAADVVLLASGTATLETMLVKRPMVVAYRASAVTAMLIRWLVKIDMASLPNLIANKRLVPEYLQQEATVDNLVTALTQYLDNPEKVTGLIKEFSNMHQLLQCDASKQAASAIEKLLSRKQR